MRIDQMHYNFELGIDRVASNDRPDFMPWEIDEFLNSAIMEFLKGRYNFNQERRGFEIDQYRMSELSNLHIKSPELQPAITPINLGNGLYEVRLDSLGNNINGQFFRYLFLTKAVITISKNNCDKKITLNLHQTDDLKTTFNQPDWKFGQIHGMFGKSTVTTIPVPVPAPNTDSADFTINLLPTTRFNNDQLQSLYLDTTDVENVQQYEVVNACISYIKYPNRVFVGGYDHIDLHSDSLTSQIHCDLDEAFHKDIVDIAVALAMRSVVGGPSDEAPQK